MRQDAAGEALAVGIGVKCRNIGGGSPSQLLGHRGRRLQTQKRHCGQSQEFQSH
ncbi:hypothetical protein [Devosia sp. DBB001]|nr:hypothetical protein [Devosia sp. DBB001]